MITYYLSLLILALIIITILSIVFHTMINGISPMPTSWRARSKMISALREFPECKNIVDAGSGWGTLCFPVSRLMKGARVTGYENSPAPFLYSYFINLILRRKNLRFLRRNFLKVNFSDTDMVLCYLHTAAMKKLSVKLRNELKVGAVVISNTFALPDWKPEKVVEVGDMYVSKIYVYRKSG